MCVSTLALYPTEPDPRCARSLCSFPSVDEMSPRYRRRGWNLISNQQCACTRERAMARIPLGGDRILEAMSAIVVGWLCESLRGGGATMDPTSNGFGADNQV